MTQQPIKQTSELFPVADQAAVVAIAQLETLARRDPGGRGLATHASGGQLLAVTDQLLASERVILVTGFCIRAAMVGETDGPSGTLALADALRQLGKQVVLVSDKFSCRLLEAGAVPFGDPFPIHTLSLVQETADREIDALLSTFSPTHVIAIERPGSAADGHRYSMRGEILDDVAPAADRLLLPNGKRTYTTIAIGDGGNELGFGTLKEALKDRVTHGDLIFCTTAADYVIPAGISNWGALALVSALAIRSGRPLLRPSDHEYAVLEALFHAGAVDGCTRKHEISVDGVAWPEYARTIDELYAQSAHVLGLQTMEAAVAL